MEKNNENERKKTVKITLYLPYELYDQLVKYADTNCRTLKDEISYRLRNYGSKKSMDDLLQFLEKYNQNVKKNKKPRLYLAK